MKTNLSIKNTEEKQMLNKVILTGRLTATPELKTTPAGVSVTQFSLAVQRNYRDGDKNYPTDFINIVAWRKSAEFAVNYFDRGQLMSVVGSLQSRSYTDKNGDKRTVYEVVADEIQFAESKRAENADVQREDITADSSQPGNTTEFEEYDQDDELPF